MYLTIKFDTAEKERYRYSLVLFYRFCFCVTQVDSFFLANFLLVVSTKVKFVFIWRH